MSELEYKRLKMELLKASAAKAELEYKVEERRRDIARIENHIKLQEEREEQLQAEIKALEDKGE